MIKISKWRWKLKAVFAIGIATIMFFVSSTLVQASSILDEVTPEETTEAYAEDTSYGILRGNHLNSGTVKVQRMSSNEIAIYGLTQCHDAGVRT